MDSTALYKRDCLELRQLPAGWKFFPAGQNVDANDRFRIYFQDNSSSKPSVTWNHPTFGPLPDPWILKVKSHLNGTQSPEYYNTKTHKWTKSDPRMSEENLAAVKKSAPAALRIAASSVRNTGIDLTKCVRSEIGHRNIRKDFEEVHAIDPGDGSVGAMNGGVFVVRMKGVPGRLFVEKRFKSADVELAKNEIKICHYLKHAALTAYTAAFIIESPNAMASLYVEFCDRGSLQNMIDAYAKAQTSSSRPIPPEGFVWHAFLGLCDGFAYLQGGCSFLRNKAAKAKQDWVPVLHRDMKPDNILLRSRFRVNSPQYFYCVLSDFGLACKDYSHDDPAADKYQVGAYKLGTSAYYAPELLYKPYPRLKPNTSDPKVEFRIFPGGHRHSSKSDIWALGACLATLCKPDSSKFANHLISPPKEKKSEEGWWQGTSSRLSQLTISSRYSKQLLEGIQLATRWELHKRPDAITLIARLEKLLDASGCANANAMNPKDQIPDWATKVHSYHRKAEQKFNTA